MHAVQADACNSAGCVHLDINLLKPSKIEFVQEPAPTLTMPDGSSPPDWLEYVYRTAHPALRWLPTKLAEWIGENMQEELGFADKANKRAQPGTGWTPAELNSILQDHVVHGELTRCSEELCMPAAILLKCQRDIFMASTPR